MTQPQWFTSAAMWLNNNKPFFVTALTMIDDFQAMEECPGAMIVLNKDDKAIFYHKPDYAQNWTAAETAAMISTTTLYVMLRHSEVIDQYDDKTRGMLASALICSDYVVNEGMQWPLDVPTGRMILQLDTSKLPFEAVYNAIPEEMVEEAREQMQKFLDKLNEMDSDPNQERLSDRALEEVRMLQEMMDAPSATKTLMRSLDCESETSNETGGEADRSMANIRRFAKKNKVSLTWAKLLARVNPQLIEENGVLGLETDQNWAQPHRATTHLYPDVLIPDEKDEPGKKKGDNAKPVIVLALDTSGSIPESMQQRLVDLAASVPKHLIEAQVCTFSTDFVEYDMEAEKPLVASGGTSFSAVERFIKRKMKDNKTEYPKAVVVITDGEASFDREEPSRKHLEKSWVWVATDQRCINTVKKQIGADHGVLDSFEEK